MMDTNMNTELSEQDAIIALLPFYISGTLEPDDLALVENWLVSDQQAPAILEKVHIERHSAIVANEKILAPRDGLARLMADVGKSAQEKTVKSQGSSLFGWIESVVLAPLKAAPSELAWAACGLLMIVTVGQSALLYQGGGQPAVGVGIELASGERHPFLSTAIVKFTPAASMAAISNALDDVGALIVDGPTASGQYIIGFTAREGGASLVKRQNKLQENVALIGYFGLRAQDD